MKYQLAPVPGKMILRLSNREVDDTTAARSYRSEPWAFEFSSFWLPYGKFKRIAWILSAGG
jgi:hypothetical protein